MTEAEMREVKRRLDYSKIAMVCRAWTKTKWAWGFLTVRGVPHEDPKKRSYPDEMGMAIGIDEPPTNSEGARIIEMDAPDFPHEFLLDMLLSVKGEEWVLDTIDKLAGDQTPEELAAVCLVHREHVQMGPPCPAGNDDKEDDRDDADA